MIAELTAWLLLTGWLVSVTIGAVARLIFPSLRRCRA